ncbi:MAG: Cobyrinic acid A,C-diamide synthase [Peptococcaceae bacterium]|jgi:cobyrinic acid a,c-diamide synthase|nr:Cobyrinic acid A,C-diamide synthase [Peptococcaceae bacterium]
MNVKVPRLLLSASHGRSGKTTVVFGLVAALSLEGLKVQPFKKGPDYIDPGWLTVAAGMPCRNLDPYLMKPEVIIDSLARKGSQADIAVIEGAMGLYDGLGDRGEGSTAELAKITKSPVILVVSTERMTRSVAALVNGFVHFDPELNVVGVILNKVANPRHESKLRKAIADYCPVPVLGAVPKEKWLELPERHLGLVPTQENSAAQDLRIRAANLIKENVDIPKLLEIARNQEDLPLSVSAATEITLDKVRIGVLKDAAFSFYYPENLEALERAGAELVFVDSFSQPELPEVHGLYIGGGFPEMFAKELEANQSLRKNIKDLIEKGLPVYAECGGLMYLTRSIRIHGQTYAMVGALACDTVFGDKPQAHGYVAMRVGEKSSFYPQGCLVVGHKFHHSKVINLDEQMTSLSCSLERGNGITGKLEGLTYKNTFATYTHIHALSTPEWAPALVEKARQYKLIVGSSVP